VPGFLGRSLVVRAVRWLNIVNLAYLLSSWIPLRLPSAWFLLISPLGDLPGACSRATTNSLVV
jgi:hypothetical protein